MNPASDVANLLAASGLGLTLGTNLFLGEMRSEDQTETASVFVLNSGGSPPLPYLGGNRKSYYTVNVQIHVRGGVEGFEAGETRARDILRVLHLAPLAGYVQVLSREAHPDFIGHDEAQRPHWLISFDLSYKASTG